MDLRPHTLITAGLLSLTVACGPGRVGLDEGFSDGYEQDDGQEDFFDEDDEVGDDDVGEPEPDLPKDGDGCQDALDILMIVDNSYSMGSAQRRAAQAINPISARTKGTTI